MICLKSAGLHVISAYFLCFSLFLCCFVWRLFIVNKKLPELSGFIWGIKSWAAPTYPTYKCKRRENDTKYSACYKSKCSKGLWSLFSNVNAIEMDSLIRKHWAANTLLFCWFGVFDTRLLAIFLGCFGKSLQWLAAKKVTSFAVG